VGAKKILGWSLAIAGVLGAAPLVLGRSQPAWKASLDEISRMSEDDRTKLDRRYKQYQALSEAERANLRKLHWEIEADRAKGDRLATTLHDYCEWLKMIDAWQQDELVHIADPLARAKRVSEIHAERQDRLAGSAQENAEGPRTMRDRLILNEDQLSRMFDVLAKRLTNVSEEDQKAIDAAKGLKRWGIQMKLLNKQVPVDRLFQTLAPAELKEMIDASGHADLALLVSENSPVPEQRHKDIIRGSFGVSMFMQKRREAVNLTDEQLQSFLAQLPREKQDQLLRMRAEDFKNQLRALSLEQDPDIQILHQMLGPLFRNAQQMFDRMGSFGGPGGPGGPGERGFRPEEGQGGRPLRQGFDGRRPEGRPFRDGFGPPGRPDDGPPPDRPPEDRPPPEGENRRPGERNRDN
jgi:hypothetical protein